jgi:hypothetical protein
MARTLSPFPPIASYAFPSECEVCAMVATTGSAVTHVIRAEEQMLSLEQPLLPVPDNRQRGISWTR